MATPVEHLIYSPLEITWLSRVKYLIVVCLRTRQKPFNHIKTASRYTTPNSPPLLNSNAPSEWGVTHDLGNASIAPEWASPGHWQQ